MNHSPIEQTDLNNDSNLLLRFSVAGDADMSPLRYISNELYSQLIIVTNSVTNLFLYLAQIDIELEKHAELLLTNYTLKEEVESLKQIHNAARNVTLAYPALHNALIAVRNEANHE